jgi:superkiller protein 3
MQECFPVASTSILAHRIVAEAYLTELDYENAIKVADSGLELVRKAESDYGKPLKL